MFHKVPLVVRHWGKLPFDTNRSTCFFQHKHCRPAIFLRGNDIRQCKESYSRHFCCWDSGNSMGMTIHIHCTRIQLGTWLLWKKNQGIRKLAFTTFKGVMNLNLTNNSQKIWQEKFSLFFRRCYFIRFTFSSFASLFLSVFSLPALCFLTWQANILHVTRRQILL